MSTVKPTTNKATFKRFQDAMSSGDPALRSKTIDELVEPDARLKRWTKVRFMCIR